MDTRLHIQARALTSSFTPVLGVLQRKCACGGSAGVTGHCEDCSNKRLNLQRSTQNLELETRNSSGIPPSVGEVLRSTSQPLDTQTREFMEPRFGHDFSLVRVHTDAQAAESARAVNALAYTVGRDVVFGAGQYQPETTEGKRLLAHELTHIVQQTNGVQSKLACHQPEDQYEQEADRAGLAISQGGPFPAYGQTGAGVIRPLMELQVVRLKADESKEDEDVTELKDKVSKLVALKFKGDYKKAFDFYDADHDKGVNAAEITHLLEDAKVGNWATRSTWAKRIIARLDINKNGKVEWQEFESGIKK